MVRVMVVAVLVVACGGGGGVRPRPGQLEASASNGIAVSFPVGSSRVTDPAHDIAVSAALTGGRTFPVTLDPFPVRAAPQFRAFADYGRVAAEGVATFDESFDRGGFTIRYIRHQGTAGDFNRFTALAVRGDRAVVLRLAGPDEALDAADTAALDAGFRAVLETLR